MESVGTGNAATLFTIQGRLPTQAEWDAAPDFNWHDAVEELRSNPGVEEIVALWNSADSGEVALIGMWDNTAAAARGTGPHKSLDCLTGQA